MWRRLVLLLRHITSTSQGHVSHMKIHSRSSRSPLSHHLILIRSMHSNPRYAVLMGQIENELWFPLNLLLVWMTLYSWCAAYSHWLILVVDSLVFFFFFLNVGIPNRLMSTFPQTQTSVPHGVHVVYCSNTTQLIQNYHSLMTSWISCVVLSKNQNVHP